SNMPSSIFTSIICAPPSTWSRATSNASLYFSSFMRRKNLRDPVTLVRSPTFIKLLSGVTTKGSKPESVKYLFFFFIFPMLQFDVVYNFGQYLQSTLYVLV